MLIMQLLQEIIEKQEAKVQCAFQPEVNSGDMRSVPASVIEERNLIREIEDENISNF